MVLIGRIFLAGIFFKMGCIIRPTPLKDFGAPLLYPIRYIILYLLNIYTRAGIGKGVGKRKEKGWEGMGRGENGDSPLGLGETDRPLIGKKMGLAMKRPPQHMETTHYPPSFQ
jgi:hypothetical protein